MSTHPTRSYAADWMLDAWSSRADQRAHLFPSFNVTDEEFHISACGKVRAAAFVPALPSAHAYCKACARHEPTPPASASPDAVAAVSADGDGGETKEIAE